MWPLPPIGTKFAQEIMRGIEFLAMSRAKMRRGMKDGGRGFRSLSPIDLLGEDLKFGAFNQGGRIDL